jgi:hypothetical protein
MEAPSPRLIAVGLATALLTWVIGCAQPPPVPPTRSEPPAGERALLDQLILDLTLLRDDLELSRSLWEKKTGVRSYPPNYPERRLPGFAEAIEWVRQEGLIRHPVLLRELRTRVEEPFERLMSGR